MNMRLNLFFVCWVCLAVGLYAQEYKPLGNPAGLKNGLAKAAENTQTLHTSFKQKKYIKILSKALESTGDMYFKKPHLLKWAYTSPYDYAIIFKENEIVINDEGKVSEFDISSSKAFLEINEVIVNTVSGNILQEDQFDISYFEGNNEYFVRLIPKSQQMKSYIAQIELYIDPSDFTVSKIKLAETSDDYTSIDFIDKKVNIDIPDSTFEAK